MCSKSFMKSKVIIIGAPRSGTNMLRDMLCRITGVATWPCDEINYVWRHGNSKSLSDELAEEMVNPSTIKYVLRQFEWVHKKFSANVVVEKTCANSLRIPFVNAIIPDAKYIYIVRDGLDVVGSAKLRWVANFDFWYSLKKIRFVPIADLPLYVVRYVKNRTYRMFSNNDRLASWGPTYDNMEELTKNCNLNVICALQWVKCVQASDHAFADLRLNSRHYVKYESFVKNPEEELTKILKFIELKVSAKIIKNLVEDVSKESIGKGKANLSNSEKKSIESIIAKTMETHGYEL